MRSTSTTARERRRHVPRDAEEAAAHKEKRKTGGMMAGLFGAGGKEPADGSRSSTSSGRRAPPTLASTILAELNACGATRRLRRQDDRAARRSKGHTFVPPDERTPARQTKEGVKAVRECCKQLRKAKPCAPLTRKAGLDLAADEHVKDLAKAEKGKGGVGHVGTDGSHPQLRMSRHGVWYGLAGEMLAYRELTAEAVVAQMLICDGTASRLYRHIAMNPEMRVCGIAVAEHPSLTTVAAVDLADGFGPPPLEVEDAGAQGPSRRRPSSRACSVGPDQRDPRPGLQRPQGQGQGQARIQAGQPHDDDHEGQQATSLHQPRVGGAE